MMTLTQYLLSKVAEEANELAKEALKGQQQGIFSDYRGKRNIDYIQDEFIDLVARASLLKYCEDITKELGDDFNLFPASMNHSVRDKMHKSICKMCYFAWMAHQNGFLQLTFDETGVIKGYSDQYTCVV